MRKQYRQSGVLARRRRFAAEAAVSVRAVANLERRLRAMPMEQFLDDLFGRGCWTFDQASNLWIARDPKYHGPGFGFIAIREDKSFFCGVVPEVRFQ
jgi:hypothetical protein